MLPLMPNEKRPLGRLVRNGLLDASTDPDQVAAWWDDTPTANIGLRTGEAFDVLDIDGPEGNDALFELAPGYKHPGPVSSTGKGWHLLFAVTGAKNGANLRPKLDFRGFNGYIVAPPSIHPSGHRYQWQRSMTADLPPAPRWLRDLVIPPKVEPRGNVSPSVAAALGQLNLVAELELLGCRFVNHGNRLTAKCPFHADDTPSLTVYLETNSFYCFGCQAWGDALNVRHFATFGSLR